jgi:23S rRNA pseudouridine2605 synthase
MNGRDGRAAARRCRDNGLMRLNAYLARAGVASRRGADELIKDGRVVVNGRRGQLNTAVEDGDRVEVDGQVVLGQTLRYVLLHKPRHVVTTVSDPGGRLTVVELVGGDTRIVPVGRLDFETTGALVLTNDGPLANRLAHPRYGVEKTYLAEVDGDPSPAVVKALARGIELDDGKTAPAKVRKLAPGLLEIVIHEGRNRQVRRMCEAVGHPVKSLHRSGYAGLEVGNLKPGKWRNLSPAEVERLRRASSTQT